MNRLSALAAVVLCAVPAGAAPILNGGFEDGTFSSWTVAGGGTIGSANPHSGTWAASFSGPADSLYQTIATTPGFVYDFTFWLAVTVPDLTENSIEVRWDGSPVLQLTNSPAFGYTEFSYSLLATSATTDVEFFFGQVPVDPGCGAPGAVGAWTLDDVSVTESGVPEPSSFALAGAAIAGLILLNLKKR